jgi:heme O synthase-like polyprenyltransferase
MCASLLLVMMAVRGQIRYESLGPLILLLLALTYFYAGLHLNPPLRWIGLLAAAGYVVVLTVSVLPWTIVGIVLASACACAGVQEWRARVVTAH